MGSGQALSEHTQFDGDGRQRNPHLLDYKLATASDVPQIDVDWIENPAENGGPRGPQGAGAPPGGAADGGRDRKRDREGDRTPRARAADASRARLGGPFVTRSYAAAETIEDALAALASGARPVAG